MHNSRVTNATSESTENLEICFFLSTSTDFCHKYNMLGLQNGPLIVYIMYANLNMSRVHLNH